MQSEVIKMAKLYFRYGAMNCGKTTAIIQVAYNYEEKGKRILLMKPSIDTKGQENVTNRSGLKRAVDYLIKPTDKIINFILPELYQGINAILIDEAQFLTKEQVDELYEISKIVNIPILCYGLRCDFQMNGFPGSTRLLQIADDIEELKNICGCPECERKATQNLRLQNNIPVFNGPQVSIDGVKDTYNSLCALHYFEVREEYDSEFKISDEIKRARKVKYRARKNN